MQFREINVQIHKIIVPNNLPQIMKNIIELNPILENHPPYGRLAKIREICNGGTGGGGAADEGEPQAPPTPSADAPGRGDGVDGVPTWCDPTHAMGAWLNFEKIREKCKELGFENFGPYGGK